MELQNYADLVSRDAARLDAWANLYMRHIAPPPDAPAADHRGTRRALAVALRSLADHLAPQQPEPPFAARAAHAGEGTP